MTVKHNAVHRRFQLIVGRLYGIGVDPDLHTCPVVMVRSKDFSGKSLLVQRVQNPRAEMGTLEIVDVRVCRVPRDVVGEEAAMLMASQLPRVIEAMVDQIPMEECRQLSFAVEGQRVDRGERTKNPDDILNLAHVAGAAAGFKKRPSMGTLATRFYPSEWKGDLAGKATHQGFVWAAFGIQTKVMGGKSPYAVPVGTRWNEEFNDGEFKHIGDSLGLARWGVCATWPF